MPVYEALDPPEALTLSSSYNAVGFTTEGDSMIDGYVIYYKIYYSGDTLVRSEELLFDPTTYENDDLNELPSGSQLPKELGFYKLGFVRKTTQVDPQLPILGGGQNVILDFTSSLQQTSTIDPVILLDGTNMNDDFGIPARGVVYSEAASYYPNYASDNTYKRFVRNYEYQGSYIDKDIKQAIDRSSSGTSLSVIEIAFVAYSYGISDTTLEPLSSIPVYLGTVDQNTLQNNVGNEPDETGL
ncbi:MAG: hypothetical protein PQJ58_03760 [Spirochaetales bacterium]|nr:hypothetical protein [Spirochaetales bacterium]